MLNERTSGYKRFARVEALCLGEMRSDLKSLKSRLDDEIRELGISERQAENLDFLLPVTGLETIGQAFSKAFPASINARRHDDDDMEEEEGWKASYRKRVLRSSEL
jgi:hypothetical protein